MKKIAFFLLLISCKTAPTHVIVEPLESGTNSLLQAISIINTQTAWISGHSATFLRTLDGGKSWESFHHKSDTLQFRDLHALSADEVILMSAGSGKASRINLFSVIDGWKETYVMPFEEGFLNTIEFWDNYNGLAFGDSFNGQFFVLRTKDGGHTWDRIDPISLPPAGNGEGGFAASGTCISTRPGGKAWIGTGAGGNARILFTEDYGSSWKAMETPMPKGEMAGTFSTRMANDHVGTLTGGDLGQEHPENHLAITKDGQNWNLVSQPITSGTFYGSDLIRFGTDWLWVICGPEGMDYSLDMGSSWINLDTANYWAVDLDSSGFGYAVGDNGRISRILVE